MKKLISIGVALALLAMVVLPVGVAAQDACEYEGISPTTYAKVPFAIVSTGIMLVGTILEDVGPTLGIPGWVPGLMPEIGIWTWGPLSWSVDMMAWGVDVVAQVMEPVIDNFAPDYLWLTDILYTVSCKLLTPWVCNVTGVPPFDPCP